MILSVCGALKWLLCFFNLKIIKNFVVVYGNTLLLWKVLRINKSNMAKVEKELKWASILQIAQSSHLDIVMASLSSVLAEINNELAVVEKGSDEYFRLTHLMSLFGGCYSAIRGADGIITGMVIDMLDGMAEK